LSIKGKNPNDNYLFLRGFLKETSRKVKGLSRKIKEIPKRIKEIPARINRSFRRRKFFKDQNKEHWNNLKKEWYILKKILKLKEINDPQRKFDAKILKKIERPYHENGCPLIQPIYLQSHHSEVDMNLFKNLFPDDYNHEELVKNASEEYTVKEIRDGYNTPDKLLDVFVGRFHLYSILYINADFRTVFVICYYRYDDTSLLS